MNTSILPAVRAGIILALALVVFGACERPIAIPEPSHTQPPGATGPQPGERPSAHRQVVAPEQTTAPDSYRDDDGVWWAVEAPTTWVPRRLP